MEQPTEVAKPEEGNIGVSLPDQQFHKHKNQQHQMQERWTEMDDECESSPQNVAAAAAE